MATKDGGSFRLSATPVTIFAHLLAIAITVLVLIWTIHFQGGFAFKSNNKDKIFNIHPTLMVIGLILLGGEAIMAYKTIPATRNRKTPKLIHLILNLIALLAGIIGIYAIFKFHKETGATDMYSLHSWFGISTISLFGLQFLLGFFSFFFPGATSSTRERLLPWHWFLGMSIFLMGIASAEIGLMDKFWILRLQHGLQIQGQQALIMNFTGLLLLLFAVSVSLSVILPKKN
ncbi:ascorbate ferrireductase (transmembrane) [Ranunculus cassubicifolius]